MKRGGHCPVWGNISVEKDNSGICSAPIGAGGLFDVNPFYRAFAPNGACGFVLENQMANWFISYTT